MLADDYLVHRLIELEPAQGWAQDAEGLHFVLAHRGRGHYGNGSRSGAHDLAPGDVLVLNGRMQPGLRARDNSRLAFYHFAARFEHLICLFAARETALLQSLVDVFHVAQHYPASSPLARQCHDLVRSITCEVTLQHRCQLLGVVSVVLSAGLEALPVRSSGFVRADDHFAQVLEELTAGELVSLHVDAMAQRFGCSRRHLNRLFHQHLGTSVSAFRMEMRLLKAVALLQDPTAKIINVAEACGFNHLGLFNARFKDRFGASPGEWRKQALLDAPTPRSAGAKPGPARALQAWRANGGHGASAQAATRHQSPSIKIIARKLEQLAVQRGILLPHL